MTRETDAVIARDNVREAVGVFRSREQIDESVSTLLRPGFDRADIDLMASAQAVREKLGGALLPSKSWLTCPMFRASRLLRVRT
jgi:hypothetical protein